ncbi:MAG TPA: signal recognition particle receptor subunit alpha, partial [Myxococcaceae bacterium]|nr:signal recognition particle receptor subunit alpha [Myxococcaceae bacterium]
MPPPPLLALAGPSLFGLEPGLLLALGVTAGVLLGLLAWVARRGARGRTVARASAGGQPSAAEPPALQPAAEDELRHRSEAALARERAQALSAERAVRAADAARASDAGERGRLEAEARGLKEQAEEAKRAAYRAEKAAGQEARARRAELQAEAAGREEEVRRRERAEAAAREQALADERNARLRAEAGQTLAAGLERTRAQGFVARLNGVLGGGRRVDAAVLGELEEALLGADIGVRTAARLLETAREHARAGDLGDAARVKALIEAEVARIVDLPAPRSLEGGGPPHVVMVVGVNGAGKTTTI